MLLARGRALLGRSVAQAPLAAGFAGAAGGKKKRGGGAEESVTALQDQILRAQMGDGGADADAGAVPIDEGTAAAEAPLEEGGTVISTKGQLVTISGLRDVSKGSAVHFERGGSAFVFDLRATEVLAAIMETPQSSDGGNANLRRGDKVSGSVDSVRFPVGSATAGRVLDGLGNPIDGKGPLRPAESDGDDGHVRYERSLVSRVRYCGARPYECAATRELKKWMYSRL